MAGSLHDIVASAGAFKHSSREVGRAVGRLYAQGQRSKVGLPHSLPHMSWYAGPDCMLTHGLVLHMTS